MPTAGTVDTAQLELGVYGPDTEASLVVRDPSTGQLADPVDGVKVDGGRIFRARVEYPVPGLWWHGWTVTGTGEGFKELYVPVGPAGPDGDPRHTYATTTDLANHLHEAPPLDAERKLRTASQRLDELLLFAVYDVDDDGLPTDPDVAAAVKSATCAIVGWWETLGWDGSGAEGQVQSASIAGVSLGFKRGSSGKVDIYGDEARSILVEAGLLGGAGPWS